jgi:hypothetical protein
MRFLSKPREIEIFGDVPFVHAEMIPGGIPLGEAACLNAGDQIARHSHHDEGAYTDARA